jgi:hypothetical protein
MLKKRAFVFILAIAACICAAQFAHAETDGKTEIHGYFESSYEIDRGIGWSGSESTMTARAKLDIQNHIYDDVMVRVSGEWQPSVGPYSRAYSILKKQEGSVNDTYMEFMGLTGENSELRLGVVKVPFGFFDTLATNDLTKPMTFQRTREWDYGVRLDKRFADFDVSFAVVNGEGTAGTDTNSDKSYAARIVFPAQKGDIYPETLEISNYPNPVVENPDGAFKWQIGLDGYNGLKYSTPIKVKNSHYGMDLKLDYSVFSMIAQYTFMEGGFTDATMNNLTGGEISALMTSLLYSSSASSLMAKNGYTYSRADSIFVEITAGVSEKTVLSMMGELYEPDMDSQATTRQEVRQRLALGLKHDFRKRVTAGLFYVFNYNRSFGKANSIVESDFWKGQDVMTGAIAVSF